MAEVVFVVPRDERLRSMWSAMTQPEPSSSASSAAGTLSSNVGVTLAAAAVARGVLAFVAALVAAGYRILAFS